MLFFNIHGNKILCFFLPCFLFSLLLKPHGNSDAAEFFSYYFFAVKTNIGITLSSPKVFSIIESSNIYLIRACNALRHVFLIKKQKTIFWIISEIVTVFTLRGPTFPFGEHTVKLSKKIEVCPKVIIS